MLQPQSMGECYLCRQHFGKRLMTRHLSKCSQTADRGGRGGQKGTPAMHLVVEGRWEWLKDYWLHLAVPTTASLFILDDFLRKIWLECCEHMSAFKIEGVFYSVSPLEEEDERGMDAALGEVVDVGTKFLYEYDFGSTTDLSLKVVRFWNQPTRQGKVELLARNDAPRIICNMCKTEIATLVCSACERFWLCKSCSAEHRCGVDYFLRVVNSPRTGVCAYSG